MAGDLLAGLKPSQTRGASHARRITDGLIATEGDFWRTDMTSVVEPDGAVTWDLGRVEDIHCGALQGDNNDTYELAASQDGTSFTPLWTAPPHAKPGMQLRLEQHIDKSARYIRLTAHGGCLYSVASRCHHCPDWPPRLLRARVVGGVPAWQLFSRPLSCLPDHQACAARRSGFAGWSSVRCARLSAFLTPGLSVDDDAGNVIRAVVAAITADHLLRDGSTPDRYPVNQAAKRGSVLLAMCRSVATTTRMPQVSRRGQGSHHAVPPGHADYFPCQFFD